MCNSEKDDIKIGNVVNCLRLNVRKEPNKDSEVLFSIPLKAEVMIEESASTEDFYKVYTASGIGGYCMKKFIVF